MLAISSPTEVSLVSLLILGDVKRINLLGQSEVTQSRLRIGNESKH